MIPEIGQYALILALCFSIVQAFFPLAGAQMGIASWVSVATALSAVGAATGASVAVAVQTEKGRLAWDFVKESRTELRKVVWPTRRETMQTTGIVLAVVTLVAIVLWLFDGAFGWAIRKLLQQGG